MHKKKGLLILLSVLVCHLAMAQNDERYEEYSKEDDIAPGVSAQILKLKKSYKLGDGITLRSSAGSFNVSQSLQTSFLVNTANKDLTSMSSTFNLTRARLSISSNLFDSKWSIYGRINLPANYQSTTSGKRSFNTVLQEAYLEYRPSIMHSFSAGLRADYIDSRETRIEGESLGFINRSIVSSSFDAIFDYGFRYKGIYKLGGKNLLKSYLSVTTGDSRASLQKNYGGFKYGVRLDYLPFDKFSKGGEFYMDDLAREEKPKLVIGVVYSYNNGASSALGTNGGRYIYGDSLQNELLPNYSKMGSDFLFKYNGWYAMGSYFITKATVPDNIAGEFRLNGSFNSGPYTTMTSDKIKDTVRTRLNLGNGINMQGGYLFPCNWAVSGRYSVLTEDNISNNFADYNKSYSVVFTKYLSGHNLKIQTEIGFDEFKNALKTATQKGNYYSQLMVTVQL